MIIIIITIVIITTIIITIIFFLKKKKTNSFKNTIYNSCRFRKHPKVDLERVNLSKKNY